MTALGDRQPDLDDLVALRRASAPADDPGGGVDRGESRPCDRPAGRSVFAHVAGLVEERRQRGDDLARAGRSRAGTITNARATTIARNAP